MSRARTLPSMVAAAALLAAPHDARAQLPMARDYQQALARGTRSASGAPGPRYWQNHARYAIDVSVAPPDRTVRGTERIVYQNASPDTLKALDFKLILNVHRPGAARMFATGEAYLTPGISVDSFAVNGRTARWPADAATGINLSVPLERPLAPGDSVRLDLGWHYELSREAGREGMIDTTSLFMAYFYPRVAVYDDVDGWDTMDFNDRQEFYSDFNDYDVTVRVPANFVVWGTGTLVEPGSVLQQGALSRYQASLEASAPVRIATGADTRAGRVTAQGASNVWRFRARNVPDVAFGISDHFEWDGTSVVVDDARHRRASVQAAYADSSADFHHMARWMAGALDHFSHRWPGVPYPYEKMTVVMGGADMEFPMMANDASDGDTTITHFVASHEVAHTYMPFYMGVNETRYAFMDEGWATTFEYFYNQRTMGTTAADALFRQFRVAPWITDPSPGEDVPIITASDVISGVAYARNSYGKAALGYIAARDLLGDERFAAGLHAYMRAWNGKHPRPWDFFHGFAAAAGENLDWFWRAWYFESSWVDRAVRGVQRAAGGYAVTVENVGGMPAPFDLVLTYTDGTTERLHQTPRVWKNDPRRAVVHVNTSRTLRALEIDGGIWMDATPADNRWTAGS